MTDIVERLRGGVYGTNRIALCGEAADELERLRAFARDVMSVWPMGDLDGGSLQDFATKHGLLTPEIRNERCDESCDCAEYASSDEFAAGVECYQKAAFLLDA